MVEADNQGDLAAREMAILVLRLACDNNLYPRQELLRLIEEKAVTAQRTAPEFYLLNYASALNIGIVPQDKYLLPWYKLRYEGRDEHTLSQEEKNFVMEMLSLQQLEDRAFGARVLVMKSRMDAPSAKWAEDRIESEIKKSSGGWRQYWQFVLRVCTRRNNAMQTL